MTINYIIFHIFEKDFFSPPNYSQTFAGPVPHMIHVSFNIVPLILYFYIIVVLYFFENTHVSILLQKY